MACLARTVSTRATCFSFSACASCECPPGRMMSTFPTMHRFYSRARFAKLVKRGTLTYYLTRFGKADTVSQLGVYATAGLGDSVRLSFSSRFAFSRYLSSGNDAEATSENWKHRWTAESRNPASEAVSSNSSTVTPMKRAQYLEKLACPGCGVYMQDKDPKGPGYFKMPAVLEELVDDSEEDQEFEDDEDDIADFDDEDVELEEGEDETVANKGDMVQMEAPDWSLDEDDEEVDEEDIDLRNVGFMEWNEVGGNKLAAKNAWSEILGGKRRLNKDSLPEFDAEDEKVVVCARCHALRNYGKVKDESLENLLPDFDFDRVVGTRLKKAYGRRAVVLMVVDGSDFDGSFPRKAAAVLAEADRELGTAWQEGKSGNTPRVLVVMNKIDLLPKQVSPNRLEQWVRRRSKAGGVPRLAGVHLVSAFKGWGVEELSERIKELAGARGDCWVVGSQNAGKSSLINSLAKFTGEKRKVTKLTEAAVPGTTLGVLKLEGILPARARLFDTPGLLHPHQITTRLNREEQKLVQVRKELKPRTFRVKKGSTVHVGGLLRLDVIEAPSESIYMTVWASAQLPCHMGKAEKAEELMEKHIGERLKPPMDKERAGEIGRWVARIVSVTGDSWDNSSVDVAVAGLGWVGIGIKGTAVLQAWTYEGIAVTTHEAMVYDMAAIFEKPGFTAMKASKGDKKSNNKSKVVRVKEAV